MTDKDRLSRFIEDNKKREEEHAAATKARTADFQADSNAKATANAVWNGNVVPKLERRVQAINKRLSEGGVSARLEFGVSTKPGSKVVTIGTRYGGRVRSATLSLSQYNSVITATSSVQVGRDSIPMTAEREGALDEFNDEDVIMDWLESVAGITELSGLDDQE